MSTTDSTTAPADQDAGSDENNSTADDRTTADNADVGAKQAHDAGDQGVGDEGAESSSANADDDPGADAGAGGNRASREAAKWRTQFRQAEQTMTDQAATIERLQRLHVDAAIERAGVRPAAVHAITDLGDLIDADTGLPDDAKVAAAVDRAQAELGIPTRRPMYDYRVGGMLKSGAGQSPPARNGFSSAFAPKDR